MVRWKIPLWVVFLILYLSELIQDSLIR